MSAGGHGRGFGGRLGLATALLIAGVALAVPAAATASSTTFGEDLGAVSPNISAADLNITNLAHTDGSTDNGAPVGGILTSVRIKTSTSSVGAEGVIKVLSLISHPDATTYNFLNDGPEFPVQIPTGTDVVTQVLTRRPIAAGERLAMHIDDSAGEIDDQRSDPAILPDRCAYYFGPSQPVGDTHGYGSDNCHGNVNLLSGTIESDADHDGFGDDTQDQCPTDGATQGPCPKTQTHTKRCKHKKHHKADAAAKKKCKKRKKR
jgi:hypothetical protein